MHRFYQLLSSFILANNTDLMALANLADEFEISLLKDKIWVFLENVQEEKPEIQLRYLKLVNMMKFSQLNDPLSKYSYKLA